MDDDPTEYVKYVFPATDDLETEGDSLIAAAEHMSIMGTVIAQAGLNFAQAMVMCPTAKGIAPVDIIENNLRMLTAGAADDSPVPVTMCCYIARVIGGPETVIQQPDIETVLETIDIWANSPHSYEDLRDLYGNCLALASGDVEEMGKMLKAVRERLSATSE